MSRRDLLDAVVVGAGVVGASAALALARDGRRVALVEAREPSPWRREHADLRVFAFAPDNATLLASLDVWDRVAAARAHPYRRMRVWDAAGGGELCFDADPLARRELGWIVENALLVDRLWASLAPAGVRVECPERVVALASGEDSVELELESGRRLRARVAIAADGAESALRGLAGIDVASHDYGQRGLVAFVDSERSHEDTCWQRFLPTGPLAFLPFGVGDNGLARSSIVWTLPTEEAQRLCAVDAAAFERELAHAFASRLGHVRCASARVAFPLRRQLASALLAGRVVAIGDAAHVVHPLAGQGVNLGLRDVASLREALRTVPEGQDLGRASGLVRWARRQRSANAMAAYAFDTINRVYSNDGVVATGLRGRALGLAGAVPPLAHALWRRASGL